MLILGAGLLITAGMGTVRWRAELVRASEAEAAARRLPRVDVPPGYVSSGACRACHPDQYRSWFESHHRQMTRPATPESVQAPFSGEVVLHGDRYALERRGDEFWMDVPEPSSRGDARASLRVAMVTGSHHMQAFWFHTPTNNQLYLAPLTWLVEEKQWVTRPDVFLTPSLAPGARPTPQVWNTSCIECHATAGRPRPRRDSVSGVDYADTRVLELGIACESCHGPGAAHVAANQLPSRRYELHASGAPDPTIVNPARLPAPTSALVCGACHAIARFADMADAFENGHAFRPGDAADPSRILLRPRRWDATPALRDAVLRENPRFAEMSFWADGIPRVSGRDYSSLVESKCFEGGKLACTTCHSMHAAPTTDQLKPGMDGDGACLPCHQELGKDIPAHTRHQASSEGSRCMSCHMPYTTYGLLKGIRSHTIASPSARESLEAGRPNACNLCHLDRSLAWTAAELTRLFGQPAVEAPGDVAAGVDWALRGNAGMRAVVAFAFGQPAAQATSGTGWMARILAELLDDPYPAVRAVAARSLRSLPGHGDLVYDYVAPPAERRAARGRVLSRWRAPAGARPELPLDAARIEDLLRRRDDRRVDLAE